MLCFCSQSRDNNFKCEATRALLLTELISLEGDTRQFRCELSCPAAACDMFHGMIGEQRQSADGNTAASGTRYQGKGASRLVRGVEVVAIYWAREMVRVNRVYAEEQREL